MPFNLKRLLTEVFEVQPGQEVVVACDVPHGVLTDSAAWQERREMAAEWRAAFDALGRAAGFGTLPLLEFPATGMNGADLPAEGAIGGDPAEIDAVLLSSTLAVFITQYPPLPPWMATAGAKRTSGPHPCRDLSDGWKTRRWMRTTARWRGDVESWMRRCAGPRN